MESCQIQDRTHTRLRATPTAATDEDLATSLLCLLDVAGDLVKRGAATVCIRQHLRPLSRSAHVHDGTDEVREVGHRANLELRNLGEKQVLEARLPDG